MRGGKESGDMRRETEFKTKSQQLFRKTYYGKKYEHISRLWCLLYSHAL